MGEVADTMINGECCSYCGVYLESDEKVYLVHTDKKYEQVRMPEDGSPFGVPVHCSDCN